MTLGKVIRNHRERLGKSLRSVARETGISAPYLSDIELDRRVPSEKKLKNLAGALDVPLVTFAEHDPQLREKERNYLRREPKARELLRLLRTEAFGRAELELLLEEAHRIAGD